MLNSPPVFVKGTLTVQIELHHTQSTPAVTELKQRTERVLADLAPYADVTLIKARTPKATPTAQPASSTTTHDHHRLPVLRIDGNPVRPAGTDHRPQPASGTPAAPTPGVVPGAVPGPETLPTEAQIRAHLTQALLTAGPSAIRLPLPHRRIIAIALILLVTGALAGQFFTGGPLITFTGIALLPIGLATNGRRTGRQPLMLAALAGSGVGALFLAVYFGPLFLSTAENIIPPATGFFYAGIAFLAAAWVPAIIALFFRHHLRQHLKARLLQEVTDTTPEAV